MNHLLKLIIALMAVPACAQTDTRQISLPQSWVDYSLASDLRHLLVNTQTEQGNPSFTYMYDTGSGKALWKMNLTDYDGYELLPTRYGALFTAPPTTRKPVTVLHDSDTGHRLYDLNIGTVFIDEALDIVIGYKSATSSSAECHRLSTGEHLWTANIPVSKSPRGWHNAVRTDDTHLLLVANSLCLLNLTDGNTLTYDISISRTIAQQGGVTVGAFWGGAIGGMVVGMSMQYGGGNMMSGMHSNILVHEGRVYLSDRDALRQFDVHSLNLIWQHQFKPKTTSAATLVANGSAVIMINNGEAYVEGSPEPYGQLFVGEYAMADGQELSYTQLNYDWNTSRFSKPLTCLTDSAYYLEADRTITLLTPRAGTLAVYDKNYNLLYIGFDDQITAQYEVARLYQPIGTDGRHILIKCKQPEADRYLLIDQSQRNICRTFAANVSDVRMQHNHLLTTMPDGRLTIETITE